MNTSHTGYSCNCIPPCYIGDRAAYITACFTSYKGNFFLLTHFLQTPPNLSVILTTQTFLQLPVALAIWMPLYSRTGIKACLFNSLYMSITAWNHVSLHFIMTSDTCKIAYYNQTNVSRHNRIIVCVCV